MVSFFDRFLKANNNFKDFFTLEDQSRRFGRVFGTFKEIGENVITGNIFEGVPVSEAFDGTFTGSLASGLSSPAGILAGTATGGTAGLLVRNPALLSSIGTRLSNFSNPIRATVTRGAGALSRIGLPTVGTTARLGALGLAGAGVTGAFSAARNFGEGGFQGFIEGDLSNRNRTQRNESSAKNQDIIDTAIVEEFLQTIGDEGSTIGTDENGNPVIITGQGQQIPIPFPLAVPQTPTPQSNIFAGASNFANSLLPLVLVGAGGLILVNLTKKR
jgi:hypothetical protein